MDDVTDDLHVPVTIPGLVKTLGITDRGSDRVPSVICKVFFLSFTYTNFLCVRLRFLNDSTTSYSDLTLSLQDLRSNLTYD